MRATLTGLAVPLLGAMLAISPAVAQGAAQGTAQGTAQAPAAPSVTGEVAPPRSGLTTASGGLRLSRLIGGSVYDEAGQKLGSVDDVILGRDGRLQAVLSVGSFLGVGGKLVAIPFEQVRVVTDAEGSRAVASGVARETLMQMPDFTDLKG